MPIKARADGNTYDISAGNIIITVDASGHQTVQVGNAAPIEDSNPIITGSSTANFITIATEYGTANVTLRNVNIDVSNIASRAALVLTGHENVEIAILKQ